VSCRECVAVVLHGNVLDWVLASHLAGKACCIVQYCVAESALQCVAAYCSVLYCVAESVLQCVAAYCSVLHRTVLCC